MKILSTITYTHFFFLFLLGSCLSGPFSWAQNDRDDGVHKFLHDLPTVQIWIDSLEQGTIHNLKQHQFQSIPNFEMEVIEASYWVQFSLKNKQAIPQRWWLHTSVFDSLTLYSVTESDTLEQHFGLLVHYDEQQKHQFRTLQKEKYGIGIELSPLQEQQFYLRIKSMVRFESTFKKIQLYNTDQYGPKQSVWPLLFHAVFFGILIFIALFSFIQFLQNKDFSYWYYALYLLLSSIYFWWKFEKSNSFLNVLFTDSPEWYYYWEIPMSMGIYITYILFVIHFINAKQEIPLVYKLLKISIGVLIIYLLLDRMILLPIGFSFSWEVYFMLRILFVCFGMVAFYLVVTANTKLSFYLISGSLVMLIGTLCTGYFSKSMTQHYWQGWDIPLLPIQVATLIELIFFSTGLGYKARLLVKEKVKMTQNLALEQLEKEKVRESQEQLSQWFTNISHEFRTPITIANGLINQIKVQPTFHLQKRLNIIQRNIQSLETLVTQLLDLSKLESGVLVVKKEQNDIIKYLGYLTESFHSIAFEKKINLSFYSKIASHVMPYDVEKLKKILCNLLFNALKFTPEYGKIIVITEVVSIEQTREWLRKNNPPNQLVIGAIQSVPNYLQIIVKDSGIGIDAKQLPHIFDKFYQVTSLHPQTEGTGIGLSLTKDLVVLLDGLLHVESSPKWGSTFSIFLPIETVSISKKNISKDNEKIITLQEAPLSSRSSKRQTETIKNSQKPLLLIVEDNADVIYYIKSCTQDTYTILEARNGIEGQKVALEMLPDIIVSDVIMPGMDGYALCKALKQDIRTSHIPFLLLTAKVKQADKQRGLEAGASAYLTKPFEKEELLLRLQNLLLWKKQLQAYLKKDAHHRSLQPQSDSSNLELQFIQQVNEKIYQHLDDETFKAIQLARAMAMSETQLYRKLKATTNQSIAQYIRSIRLKEAYELLETTDLAIGDIASKVGFRQLSHFSKVFHKQYNKRPSELRK